MLRHASAMYRIFIYAPLFLALLLNSCGGIGLERRKQSFLHKGNLAYRDKMYEEALRFYGEAIRLDSCYAVAQHNFGVILQKTGREAEALAHFNAALACDSSLLDAYFSRSTAYLHLGEGQKAIPDLSVLVRQFPDSAIFRFTLGLARFNAGQYAEAGEAFLKALQLDSVHWESWINLGAVRFYQSDLRTSEEAVRKGLAIKPEEANGWNVLGMIALQNCDYSQAAEYLAHGLSLEPDNAYLLNNRAYLYMMEGKMPAALRDLRASLALDPDNAWAYRNMGLYFLLNREYTPAIAQLEQAYLLDSLVQKTQYYLGEAYWHTGRKTDACGSWSKSAGRGEAEGLEALQKYCR